MQLFYSTIILDDEILLDKQESHHCIRVLRKKMGDKIYVIDGNGPLYTGEIIEVDPKKCVLRIIDKNIEFHNRESYIHIAIAPTKSMDRFSWFLEKAVEIGIDEFSLLITQNSERQKINIDKCKKTIISATKQSLQGKIPIINELINFNEFMQFKHKESAKSIGFIHEEIKSSFADIHHGESSHLICIGPEGDFSNSEIDLAIENGFSPISLGNTRLRTETAGMVATTLANQI